EEPSHRSTWTLEDIHVPTYSAGPLPSSNTAMLVTSPATPSPTGSHDQPFQRAMLSAGVPPAVRKAPPTYRAGPVPSSKTWRARTRGPSPYHVPSTPPRSDRHSGSHCAAAEVARVAMAMAAA